MTKITEMIWLGGSYDAEYADLRADNIDAILNVARGLHVERGWSNDVEYAKCGLVDGPGNTMTSYYAAVLKLAALVRNGLRTLVCCREGQSRSPAIVIMYLNVQKQYGWDYWRMILADLGSRVKEGKQFPHEAHRQAFDRIDWQLLVNMIESNDV